MFELSVPNLYRHVHVAGCILLQVSIDAHTLQVVAADGYYVDPVEVDVISFLPGTSDIKLEFVCYIQNCVR